jgi:hypothetical protein
MRWERGQVTAWEKSCTVERGGGLPKFCWENAPICQLFHNIKGEKVEGEAL